ncbi:MAG: tetratricopeptide repeat protein [Polyangiales bacterium]
MSKPVPVTHARNASGTAPLRDVHPPHSQAAATSPRPVSQLWEGIVPLTLCVAFGAGGVVLWFLRSHSPFQSAVGKVAAAISLLMAIVLLGRFRQVRALSAPHARWAAGPMPASLPPAALPAAPTSTAVGLPSAPGAVTSAPGAFTPAAQTAPASFTSATSVAPLPTSSAAPPACAQGWWLWGLGAAAIVALGAVTAWWFRAGDVDPVAQPAEPGAAATAIQPDAPLKSGQDALADAYPDSADMSADDVAQPAAAVPARARATALWKQGFAAFERGAHAEAEALYLQATEADPRYAPPWNSLGRIQYEQGKLAKAEAFVQEALALDRDYAPAHNNLGVIALKRKQHGRAKQHFRAALKAQPDYGLALHNLAALQAREGHTKQARKTATRALKAPVHNRRSTERLIQQIEAK